MAGRRMLLIGATVALSLSALTFVAAGDGPGASSEATRATYDNDEARLLGASVGDLQRHLVDNDRDSVAWGRLGLAYVETARQTGDPSLYPKAQGAFERSLALNPTDNFAALAGQGALANARHDFTAGFEWGERARALNPASPEVHAVVGDALLELGRYDDAFASYQKMADLAPGLGSYARVSYALELQGDVDGARRSLELALGDAFNPASRAFADTALGDLAWNTGDVDEAQRRYEAAAAAAPELVTAQAGLARVAAARGDLDGSTSRWQQVVQRSPLPEYVAELGYLHAARGQTAQAQAQFDLVGVQRQLADAAGVNGDLELALFSADLGTDLDQGLAAAEDEWKRRKSILVADALAWQLHAHGRHADALAMADKALALGTRSALFHFHRGMIRQATGDEAGAVSDLEAALRINPHFSTRHAPTATATLATLTGP